MDSCPCTLTALAMPERTEARYLCASVAVESYLRTWIANVELHELLVR